MAALAVVTIDTLNNWVGDVGALLWISAGYFFPFVTGIALGPVAAGVQGRILGAVVGAIVVLAPTIGYAIVKQPNLADIGLPLIWGLFTPLAIAQGAVSAPVGAAVRSRPPRH